MANGRKDHKCGTCGKSLSTSSYLKQHIQTIHECRKDYICDSCDKTFTTLQKLEKPLHTIHDGYSGRPSRAESGRLGKLGSVRYFRGIPSRAL